MKEVEIEGPLGMKWKVVVRKIGVVIKEYEEDLRIGRVEIPWDVWQEVVEAARK